ncbi:hypothetical protein PAXRUDRAFT_792984, partial [Paxillus rubicundulus Ve08.2h10]
MHQRDLQCPSMSMAAEGCRNPVKGRPGCALCHWDWNGKNTNLLDASPVPSGWDPGYSDAHKHAWQAECGITWKGWHMSHSYKF